MSLRTVEIYHSYQGEGPQTGKPTTFVRFAGCNLKCPAWPCDTQHAIDPKLFRDKQTFWNDTPTLLEEILGFKCENVCLTGGEVFLQPQVPLTHLVMHLKGEGAFVECFTNGTLGIKDQLLEMIDSFILDWKLPGSGETFNEEVEKVRRTNLELMGEADAIKFTVADRKDFEVAKEVWEELILGVEGEPQVYVGVVWDKLKTETLVQWLQEFELPWNLNVQTHKFIWPADKIGV